MITADTLAALDREDTLAPFREQFDLPDGVVYLDGNSLGPLPRRTLARLIDVVREEWGQSLIRAWNDHDWIGAPQRVGDKIAGIVGASPGEVVAADSTSVNLFKLLAAACALRPERRVILTEAGNFPTDIYIAEGLVSVLGEAYEVRAVEKDAIGSAIGDDVAVVLLTHVDYRTGEMLDMASIARAVHDAGALMLWDLSHSAGAVPVALNETDADFAVGCGYKYLNGGPGAPAFLFVAEKHQAAARQPLSGWMGHAAPFDFENSYRPAEGVSRHLAGTPAILGLAALEQGLDLFLEADMAAIRHKSVLLTEAFISLVEQECPRPRLRAVQPARFGEARQPGRIPSPGRVCHHAGADRSRRDRRFPQSRYPAVRFRAALYPFPRPVVGGIPAQRHHGKRRLGPPRIQTQGGRDVTDDKKTSELPEGAHTDFADDMTYGDYLRLDAILSAQAPVSAEHDEHLFIVIHQTTELWMKLVLHELRAAIAAIAADDLRPAFKMLARVGRIQSQLIQSWDVLSTLTPADYLTFRDALGHSSGFQSCQYRQIEFLFGNKNRAMLEPHRDRPADYAVLTETLQSPTLYDEVLRLLARRGLAVPDAVLNRDVTERYAGHDGVTDVWMTIYRDTETWWTLYELAEELVDLEDWFQQWRFRHVTTVERIIGNKRGTGGTAGVSYLQKALDIRFFPELWDVRTAL